MDFSAILCYLGQFAPLGLSTRTTFQRNGVEYFHYQRLILRRRPPCIRISNCPSLNEARSASNHSLLDILTDRHHVIFQSCARHFLPRPKAWRYPVVDIATFPSTIVYFHRRNQRQHCRRHCITITCWLQSSTFESMAGREAADKVNAGVSSLHHRQS